MRVEIKIGIARGEITAPPSKSMAHRLLIAAALADGTSTVRGISFCEDVLATMDCLTALGVKMELRGDTVEISSSETFHCVGNETGKDHAFPYEVPSSQENSPVELYCRESGSTLRFLLPIAMLSGKETVFRGADSLMARPMSVYEDIAAEKGLQYEKIAAEKGLQYEKIAAEKGLRYEKDGIQIKVRGPLRSGVYSLPGNVSSQFVSGLLFALPLVEGDSEIRLTTPVESRSYIDLTIDALRTFGVTVCWADDQTLKIRGSQQYRAADVTVEGDDSGAAFPDALNLFGGSVKVKGLREDSLQGDSVYPKLFAELAAGTPVISIGDCPDLAPILFAVAAAKNGATFLDTARLKLKESDRAEAMAAELRKFGARVTVNDNSVIVEPADFHAPTEMLCGHNDHRIVMALAVLCTVTGGEIDGAEAVTKSYPGFFEDLKVLGIDVKWKLWK